MNYILDTNVVSEVRKAGSGRADANVIAWLTDQERSRLYISTITLMELQLGILQIGRRDIDQGLRLATWLKEVVLTEFANRILPVDAEAAIRCAHLHVPDPRLERDALIAATALTGGMTLVTRNVADFRGIELAVINPWMSPASSARG